MQTELTVTSRGREFPVELDESSGKFCVILPHSGAGSGVTRIRAESLAALKTAVDKATKSPIDVGFTLLTPPFRMGDKFYVRAGTVTGKHATTGSYLIRWASGDTEQMSRFQHERDILGVLDVHERVELDTLIAARHTADEALIAFTSARHIDLADRVRKAMES